MIQIHFSEKRIVRYKVAKPSLQKQFLSRHGRYQIVATPLESTFFCPYCIRVKRSNVLKSRGEAVKLSAWPWSFLVSFYGLSTHQSTIGRKDIKISVNVF